MKFIVIPNMNSLWRADQIAALGRDGDLIWILPVTGVNGGDTWEYTYDTEAEAETAFGKITSDLAMAGME